MPVGTLASIEILWEEVILVSSTLGRAFAQQTQIVRFLLLKCQGQHSCNQPSSILPLVLTTDKMDVLVTRIVTSGGGWLLKRQKPGFNTQQGWKRRWVGIYDGELFYSKKQTIPKLNSKDHDAKSMALAGLVIMNGSDGLTIRLHDPNDKNRSVDWKSSKWTTTNT